MTTPAIEYPMTPTASAHPLARARRATSIARCVWLVALSTALTFLLVSCGGMPATTPDPVAPDAALPPTPDAGPGPDAPIAGPHLDIAIGSMGLTSWDFGNQVVGTRSAGLALTITNDTMQVSAVLAVTADPAFPIDAASTCPAGIELAPGASCSILIRFAPASEGASSGTLAVDAGPAVGQASLSLSGLGVPAADLDTSPPFVDFGAVEFGTTATATVALVNSGVDVAIQSIAIGNPIGSGYSLQSTTCGPTLAAGAQCDLVVAFTPTAFGQDSADLTIVTDHGNYAQPANWLLGEGGARLTIVRSGTGVVQSDGGGVPGIDCGTDCTSLFVTSLDHQLTASTSGAIAWGGGGTACGSAATCDVTLSTTGPTTVVATFTP